VGDKCVLVGVNRRGPTHTTIAKVGRKLVHVVGGRTPFDASLYPCVARDAYGHDSIMRPHDYAYGQRRNVFVSRMRGLLGSIGYGTDEDRFLAIVAEIRATAEAAEEEAETV
jgi:hypothetical protein